MPLLLRPTLKWLAPALLLALTFAVGTDAHAQSTSTPTIETYTDEAVPTPPGVDDRYNSPLSAGQLTLQDVLKAHSRPVVPPPAAAPPVLAPAPASSPLMDSTASSTNIMLMQGMKSALQQSGADITPLPPLRARGSVDTTTTVSTVNDTVPAPPDNSLPGVHYEPGQAPKNLADGLPAASTTVTTTVTTTANAPLSDPNAPVSSEMPVSSYVPLTPSAASPTGLSPSLQPATAPPAVASTSTDAYVALPQKKGKKQSQTEAPLANTAANAVSVITPGCDPHVESWTKTCIEAGYPASFTGKITGETRTVCPDKSLQDVWIANSCAPPDDTGAGPDSAPGAASSSSTGSIPSATASSEAGLAAATSATPSGSLSASAKPKKHYGPSPYAPTGSDVPATSAAATAANVVTSATDRTDANCGAANGLAANAKPIFADLCAFGNPSDVSGNGPWRWSCKGINGGMTVSCAAPVAENTASATAAADTGLAASYAPLGKGTVPPAASAVPTSENGACGVADNNGTDQAPSANLCSKGAASPVSGNGPWTWACSGFNGGSAAACTAPKKIDGICGGSSQNGASQMPSSDLCTAGYASAVTGDGPWNWTCSGSYGGAAATCSAAPKRAGVCGSASLTGHHETPQDSLCSVGSPSYVHGGGPWSWTCSGPNNGATVNCTAAVSISGSCGSANGVATDRAPNQDLCTRGQSTRVTGTGPWSWNCAGSEGGDTESCTAPMISRQQREAMAAASAPAPTSSSSSSASAMSSASDKSNLCGPAAELMALEPPDRDLCRFGSASEVSGNGPWSWTCADDDGHASTCGTLSPTGNLSNKESKSRSVPLVAALPAPEPVATPEGAACGYAAGQGVDQAPSGEGLCATGRSGGVKGVGPWHWTCIKGKSRANCDAPKQVDGTCGIANGSVQKFAPTRGLCKNGSPTEIQGTGPWMWTCVGAGGGVSTSCSATAQSQTRVDGSCGAASNTPAPETPSVNLCDSGVASTVYGDGPWTWTCSGLNGGIATSCSAQKNLPQAPPPPGPPVNGLCGASNGVAMVDQPVGELCSAGTVTAVSGNGPWNWNCIGANGGMTVSCTAPLQPPAPVTGVCGSANGVPTLTTPRSGLCSAGISSSVSGKGPWTWSCSGTNGGGAVGCVAPLAGTDVGALPSMVTTPGASVYEAPAPLSAPTSRVTSSGLVTPRLPSGSLPPLDSSGTMPPSPNFGAMPTPSTAPGAPSVNGDNAEAPGMVPDLPAGTMPLQPPPIRDTLAPSPALKPPAIDITGNLIPGNHFVLPDDIQTITFVRGSENLGDEAIPVLDKLALVLKANSGVRITLTAYADNSNGISPRDARRLSLSRALAIRDYLTSKAISSSRIDVRALGANVTSGDPDRVDIKSN